jgi:NADP-dependent 3-hydroxy acid dehydrogenase YdfG
VVHTAFRHAWLKGGVRLQGAKVVATGRNEAALQALAAEIGCDYAVGDLTEPGVCERVVRTHTHWSHTSQD